MDALLEEGLCVPKKRRMDEKYRGESDHQSDGETTVQPMMTKIKTVLKSKLLQRTAHLVARVHLSFSFKRPALFPFTSAWNNCISLKGDGAVKDV